MHVWLGLLYGIQLIVIDVERPNARIAEAAGLWNGFLIAGINYVISAKKHTIARIKTEYVL